MGNVRLTSYWGAFA